MLPSCCAPHHLPRGTSPWARGCARACRATAPARSASGAHPVRPVAQGGHGYPRCTACAYDKRPQRLKARGDGTSQKITRRSTPLPPPLSGGGCEGTRSVLDRVSVSPPLAGKAVSIPPTGTDRTPLGVCAQPEGRGRDQDAGAVDGSTYHLVAWRTVKHRAGQPRFPLSLNVNKDIIPSPRSDPE